MEYRDSKTKKLFNSHQTLPLSRAGSGHETRIVAGRVSQDYNVDEAVSSLDPTPSAYTLSHTSIITSVTFEPCTLVKRQAGTGFSLHTIAHGSEVTLINFHWEEGGLGLKLSVRVAVRMFG